MGFGTGNHVAVAVAELEDEEVSSDSSFDDFVAASSDKFSDIDVHEELIPGPPLYSPITSSDSESEDESDTSLSCDDQVLLAPDVQNSTPFNLAPSFNCTPLFPSSFKIIGDNVDKNVTPRYIRSTSEQQVKSLHYYHSYAVRDRIDVSSFPNELSPTCIPPLEICAKTLLPNEDDDSALIANIKVLFSRILVQTLPFFNMAFSDLIVDHINHRRHKEMSSKSCIVSI